MSGKSVVQQKDCYNLYLIEKDDKISGRRPWDMNSVLMLVGENFSFSSSLYRTFGSESLHKQGK